MERFGILQKSPSGYSGILIQNNTIAYETKSYANLLHKNGKLAMTKEVKVISEINTYDYFDGLELIPNQKAGKEFWFSSSDSDIYMNSRAEILSDNKHIRFDLFGNRYGTINKRLALMENSLNAFTNDDLKIIADVFHLEYIEKNNLGNAHVKGRSYQINELRYKKNGVEEFFLINTIGGSRAPEYQFIYGIWKVEMSNGFRGKYFE
ncbi:MAG: hypothetical protein ACXVNM_12540 [Bacteroidia bacterium]